MVGLNISLRFIFKPSYSPHCINSNVGMSKIIFDSGISLDGFFAGDNRSPGNPMGGVSGKIHTWMLNQKAFGNT
jgi:hypothetical protein